MESKRCSRVTVIESEVALLIEPVWNRNFDQDGNHVDYWYTFNRTSMESKLWNNFLGPSGDFYNPFNRTSMESKQLVQTMEVVGDDF